MTQQGENALTAYLIADDPPPNNRSRDPETGLSAPSDGGACPPKPSARAIAGNPSIAAKTCLTYVMSMTTIEDFAVGRNNPIENVDRAELNNLLGVLAAAFGWHLLRPQTAFRPCGRDRMALRLTSLLSSGIR